MPNSSLLIREARLDDNLFLDCALLDCPIDRLQQPRELLVLCSQRYQYHQKIQPPYTAFGYTSSMLSHCTMKRSAIG